MKGGPHASGRGVNGIVLLDKPAGMTSNEALQQVKRIYRARKAGHTGSLDPLATGLLPICLGEATKISGFLLEADKHYLATIRLGAKTATGDAEGATVAARADFTVERQRLAQVLERFRGAIEQTPPMFSAVKRHGTPLYKLAHRGIEVERDPRTVVIRSLEMRGFDGRNLEIEVRCSKGTYVRTLADDIGDALGCGGHVTVLRRIGVGGFDDGRMVALEELRAAAAHGDAALDAHLLSMEAALGQWPGVRLSADSAYFLCQGQAVFVPQAPARGLVRIYGGDDRFLGIGRVLEDGRVAPKRLVNSSA